MATSVKSVLLQSKACVTIPASVAKQSATVSCKSARRSHCIVTAMRTSLFLGAVPSRARRHGVGAWIV